MIKNILFYSLIGVSDVTVFYYFSATSSSKYSDIITEQHKEQKRNLNAGDSLETIKKLNYFTVNENYITTAKVNILDSSKTLSVKK